MRKAAEIAIRLKDRAPAVFLAVLFRFLLDLSYATIVSERFAASGYDYSPRGPAGLASSYVFTIVLAALLSPDLGTVSRIVVFYLFLFTYIPASSLFALNDAFSPVPYLLLTASFFFLFLGVRLRVPVPLWSPRFRVREGLALRVSLAAAGITLAVLLARYGVPTRLPSLGGVYEVRGAYKETFSRIVGYVVGWQGNVFNGFLFMAGLLGTSVPLILGALVLQLYLYSITGFKSLLFSFLFLLWLGAGLRFFGRYLAPYLAGTVCAGLVPIHLAATYFDEWALVPAIFLVRLYFVPAQLFYYYYDFFSSHYIDWFAQNLPFSLVSKSNYAIPIPYVIGDYYFRGAEVSANANVFADGYANLGIAGYLLVTLVLLALLRGLDAISAGKNPYLVLSLVAMPMFSLTNTALPTTLLTHGFLMAMIVILLLPENEGGSGKGEVL